MFELIVIFVLFIYIMPLLLPGRSITATEREFDVRALENRQ